MLAIAAGCGASRTEIRPAAPPRRAALAQTGSEPVRVAIAATVFREAIADRIEDAVPREGLDEAPVLGGRRVRYRWRRERFAVSFAEGRIAAAAGGVATPGILGLRDVPLGIGVSLQPAPGFDGQIVAAPGVAVEVTASGPVDRLNRAVETQLTAALTGALAAFRIDLRALLSNVEARLARPLPLPVGSGAADCLALRVSSTKVAPPVLAASAIETDIEMMVAISSQEISCAPPPGDRNITGAPREAPLPPGLRAGAVRGAVDVPVRYQEFERAMAKQGKLRFSSSHPGLFLETPRVQPSGDMVIVQLSIGGASGSPGGASAEVGGDLFLSGRPRAAGAQLELADLDLSPETADQLSRVRPRVDAAELIAAARAALRVDLGERLAAVRERFSRELSFGDAAACVRAESSPVTPDRVDVGEQSLRVRVLLDGRAALSLPCTP